MPVVQILVFVAVWLLKRAAATNYALNFNYYIPAERIVTRLNYPLTTFWSALIYVLDRLPMGSPRSGGAVLALALVAGLVFLSSVGLFWYLVVREIELHTQKKSLLKFHGSFGRVLVSVILFIAGIGALVSMWGDARTQLPLMWRDGSVAGLLLTVLPELFLLLWAAALIAMSVKCARGGMKDKRHISVASNVGNQ